MKKRVLSLVMACVMTSSLLAGCGNKGVQDSTGISESEPSLESSVENATEKAINTTDETAIEETKESEISVSDNDLSDFKVICLVNGYLGDKGFFDSVADGLTELRSDTDAEVRIIEMGRDTENYKEHFLEVSQQDWDLIISGTSSTKELLEEVSVQFPEKNYMYYDGAIDRDMATEGNVMSIEYTSKQSAFMVGCLSAMMFESGDEKVDSANKIVGFIGFDDTNHTNDVLSGYKAGIQYVDPEIQVITSSIDSSVDSEKCMEIAAQLYAQGAQIVYTSIPDGIVEVATAASNADKYMIACDQDLYRQLEYSQPDVAKFVLTSSLKDIGQSLYTAVLGFVNGTMTCDKDYTLGLDTGAVGLAKNDNYMMCVPEDIQTELDRIEQMIISGQIDIN